MIDKRFRKIQCYFLIATAGLTQPLSIVSAALGNFNTNEDRIRADGHGHKITVVINFSSARPAVLPDHTDL